MRLAGERVLVTGSTAGIGRSVAVRCAAEGARVCVHGRDAARGEAVVSEIAARGGEAIFVPADLAEEAACTTLVETAAARLGGLTVLVNNAAIGGMPRPLAELDTADWERVLRLNLDARWRGSAAPPCRTCCAPGTARS